MSASEPSARALLRQRRLSLLQQSARLREALQQHSVALSPLAQGADRAQAVGRWLQAHPWCWAPALAWGLWRHPRQVWRWGRRAWKVWRWGQQLRRAWAQSAPAPLKHWFSP